ncbi:MAG: glycosyltransferase [Acidobacteria bacterium]|nr:glycosyltransferase [Acidobacteriota bacterium]MCA1618403.1 glycosyltransferase [Acidobacteriota bacterium]
MIKGLVSVIIPTYNRAGSVVEAVASARAQTYPHKQILVVDDGSRDDTARRLADLEGVEYHYQENRGQGAARNRGLSLARGEFVASLDSDDLWDDDFLASGVECLEAFGLDFCFANWTKVRGAETFPSEWLRDGKWRPYRKRREGDWCLLNPDEVRKLFLEICPAPSSSLVVRRSSIVSGWGERMRIADDWYLLLEMALGKPCRAAFSLTPRWRKRVDGQNVYDGRPFAESARELYLHDHQVFRKDFRAALTRRESFTLARRAAGYRLRLLLHEAARTRLGARLKLPALFERLRGLTRKPVVNHESVGRGLAGKK